MEKKNTNVLLTVIGVMTLLMAVIGATFAYFTAAATTDEQNVKTGKLFITSTLSGTTQANIKPTAFVAPTASTDDDDATTNADIAKFEFKVTGTNPAVQNPGVNDKTTVTGATYDIYLTGLAIVNDDSASGETPTEVPTTENKGTVGDVKYSLYNGTSLIGSGDFSNVNNIKINNASVSLTGDTNDIYTLFVYIEESNLNQDNLQNVKINVTMNAQAKTPSVSN